MNTTKKLLVITDLDSSLLNEDYSFMEAWGVIRQLKLLGFPIIFNSSKTMAEMQVLAGEMGLNLPMVAENGGVLCFPNCAPWMSYGDGEGGAYTMKFPGLDRERILLVARQLREQKGYQFVGYGDWTSRDVMEHTGLDEVAAELSLERVATEPIIWNDSEEAWAEFEQGLREKGIRALRGGRFVHLMGSSDKADGLRSMHAIMKEQEPETEWMTVALGDSQNDLEMLNVADIAVVIPRGDEVELNPSAPEVIRPSKQAAAGWAEAIQSILTRI